MAVRRRPKNQGITIIKKANDLIEARYKFDVWETRFFLSVLSQIRREDTEFKTYRIWYKDVARTFGLRNHNAYDLLRNAAASLMQKVFTVSYEDKGFTRQLTYHIIRKTDVLKEGQEDKAGVQSQEYIDVTVEQEMKPLLLQLQRNFTAYELRNVVKLGVYPIRIYELLKQYESIGERTITIEALKKMFELEAGYSRFPNLNQRVIIPAVNDINRYSDLNITDVIKIKEGRAVAALRFRFVAKTEAQMTALHGEDRNAVKPPPPQTIPIPFPKAGTEAEFGRSAAFPPDGQASERDRLFKQFYEDVVQKFGVTPSSFLDLLQHHTEEEVNQAIRVTRRAKVNGQIKTSVPGFFVHALKNGFTDPKEEDEKKRRRDEERQQLASRIEALRDEYMAKVNDLVRLLVEVDGSVRTEAIRRVTDEMQGYIALKYPAETPDMETFRQDAMLRSAVIKAIMDARRVDFLPIENEYLPRIEALRKELEAI